MDWGTVPAWVGAVGTIGAFITGFVLIRRETKTRRRDDLRRNRIAADQLRITEHSTTRGASVDGDWRLVTRVHNTSPTPFDNVVVVVTNTRSRTETFDVHIGSVPAGGKSERHNVTVSASSDAEWEFAVRFTDTDGYAWRRVVKGVVELVK